ncbi:MAG: hypothetical protein HFH62_10690 [Lachnospiraceae bacterium]|nr:hypothetical protein [Lachnospiraceae bacterium]
MSLTIDYVSMPPKSQEMSQIQTNEITRMNQENQQLAAQFQEQVKQSSEKTIRREKAQNEELKNDEERRNRQRKKKKGHGAQGEDSPEDEKDEVKHFDMKI